MSEYKIEYIQAKANIDTVMVDGYLLHSKYNPLQEAKMFAEREINQGYVHILFGYGLGYIANELIKLLDGKEKLIIIDPLFDILDNPTVDSAEFIVINSIDELEIKKYLLATLENYERKIKVICSPNYDKILQSEYLVLLKIIKDIQNTNIVNENTIRLFSNFWQENYIKNLLFMSEDASLKALQNAYTLPIVIASGGPSLTKQLPKLKAFSSKCIIIAAGSTINSLLAADIEPDFIVTIDGSDENYVHFKDLHIKSAKLIYSVGSYYKIQENFKGERVAFVPMKEERLQKYIKNKFSTEIPIIFGGGSVANFALHIATLITSGPIAFIGQDLAYTNNEFYAKNNKNLQIIKEDVLNKREFIETEGYYGEKVFTTYEYLPMKESFEAFIRARISNNEIYNCTEGGVKISGMNQIPFDEFCLNNSRTLDKSEKNIIINKNNLIGLSMLINVMGKELRMYKEMKADIKIAIKEVESTKKTAAFSPKNLNTLEKVDKKLKRNFEKVILERIADPLIIDVMRNFMPSENETKLEAYERVYKQNLAIYTGLLYVIHQTEAYIEEILEMAKAQMERKENI
ncbi:6-hydroxymethylpterin diphosphokinase MptE-like protein [Lysinibacillus louembei]|uniref:6-hydroxymethylpterin diphosphokinase MptE-like protein n=1 Tax=Lysinibacillus louembei TaxID=1470088 RepID=A0ABZ0RZI3_9BACI|nr:6-hydroxymethylpterin diphosphokinase MptE-like protein [Lysinibacillus louembei]WPK12409.1 6-hydroxymethylpterin diphosphokinase MptE-like protein [Lysinibacillus louembei]